MDSLVFSDQMGRAISPASFPPKKIVSLVPSQTELLFSIGAADQLVGVTRFCIHPKEKLAGIEKIGGTKSIDLKKIMLLQPDLIIGNKEENEQKQIEELARHFPVWMSDVTNLDDALTMIRQIGLITAHAEKASVLAEEIDREFLYVKEAFLRKRVLYLIWKNPWMAAGQGTFIDDMLSRCGFENVCPHSRYPQLSSEEIILLKPDAILLSSEPYPFCERHLQELYRFLPDSRIMLVNGELFSWYGSRLRLSPAYFRSLQKELE